MHLFRAAATAVLMLGLLAGPVSVAHAQAPAKTVTVKAVKANLRAGPGVKNKKIESLSQGTTLEVIGQSGKWTQVRHGSQTGYVANNLIR